MKKIRRIVAYLCAFILIASSLVPAQAVSAAPEQAGVKGTSTDIEELSVGMGNSGNVFDQNLTMYSAEQIADNLFYIYMPDQGTNGVRFTGVLSSSSAELTVTDIADPANKRGRNTAVEYDYGYRPIENGEKVGKRIEPEDVEGKRPFHTLEMIPPAGDGKAMMYLPLGSGCYRLTVTDGDQIKDYYVILSLRAKTKSSVPYANMPDEIRLLDKDYKELDETYQYAKGITDWNNTSVTWGFCGLPEKAVIPDKIPSVRLKLSRENLSTSDAYYEKPRTEKPDYFYYQNNYCYSVNGGELKNFSGDGSTGEIVLQQGYNIIFIGHQAKETMTIGDISRYGSSVLLLYREGENTYTRLPATETDLASVQIYRAATDAKTAKGMFREALNTKKEPLTSETKVELASVSPYVFIMAEAKNSDSKIEIPNSTEVDGGFLVKYNHERDTAVNINVIPEEGDAVMTSIPINWTVSDVSLNALEVIENGRMTSSYTKGQKEYYLIPDDMDKPVKLKYDCSDSLEIKVNRADEFGDSVLQNAEHTVTLDPRTQHQVVFRVTGVDETVNTYSVALKRENTSDHSEAISIAKPYLESIMEFYKQNLGEKKAGGTYWTIFAMKAAGENLDGYNVYNVLDQKRTQATDYAGVILELVMLGENPFDYGGVNFVELLQSCRDNSGNYGPYACNIYALYALDAVGIEDEKLVQIVAGQAVAKSFDLDMRGWAVAAIQNHMDTPGVEEKSALAIEDFKNTQGLGDPKRGPAIPGAFENFWYYNSNSATQSCVIMGLTAAGINLQESDWRCQGRTPIEYYASCFDENGKPTKESVGSMPAQVVIALSGIINQSCVFPDNMLTLEKVEVLLDRSKSIQTDKVLQGKIDNASNALQTLYDANNGTAAGMGKAYFELNDLVGIADSEWKYDTFMGSEEQKAAVEDVADQIKDISVSYKDKDKILTAKKAYDNLSEYSSNGDEGTAMLQHYVKHAYKLDYALQYIDLVEAFTDAVESIGTVQENSGTAIQEAYDVYGRMDDEIRKDESVSTAYDKLLKANQVYEVIAAIASLPQLEALTLEDADAVSAARASYDALDTDLKAQISNSSDLITAEKKIRNLKAVKTVSELIEALPDSKDLSYETDGDAVKKAYQEYMLLTEEQRELLDSDQRDKLLDDYETIKEQQSDAEAVREVIENIADIPALEELTLEDDAFVKSVRGLYESLSTEELKARVTNYTILTGSEAKLTALKQEDLLELIDKLPDPETLEGHKEDGSDMKITEGILQEIAAAVSRYQSMDEALQKVFANENPAEYRKLMDLKQIAEQYNGYIEEVLAPLVEEIASFELPVTKYNMGIAGDLLTRYEANEEAKTYLNSIVWEDGTHLQDKMETVESQLSTLNSDLEAAAKVDNWIEDLPDEVNQGNVKDVKAALEQIQKQYDALSEQAKTFIIYLDRWEDTKTGLDDFLEAQKITEAVISQIEDAVDEDNDLLSEDTVVALKKAEAAYDALTPSQKTLISADLVKAMDTMKEKISAAKKEESVKNKLVTYNGTIPWDVVLKIERIAQSEDSYALLRDELDEEKKASILNAFNVTAYQILEDGSYQDFMPEGGMSLTVHTDEDLSGKTPVIAHLKEDGTVEFLQADAKDGDITFTTQSLSPFASGVIRENTGSGDDGDGSNNNGNNTNNSNNSNTGTQNKGSSGNSSTSTGNTTGGNAGVPKTGDVLADRAESMMLLLFMSTGVLMLCLKKKKKSEHLRNGEIHEKR